MVEEWRALIDGTLPNFDWSVDWIHNPYKSLLFIQSRNYGLNQEIAQFQRKIDKPIPQIWGETKPASELIIKCSID